MANNFTDKSQLFQAPILVECRDYNIFQNSFIFNIERQITKNMDLDFLWPKNLQHKIDILRVV